jgi:uncharacterized protein (TIGR00251 family)
MDQLPAWARPEPDGFTLLLHVQPGAKRTEAAGQHGDALKVRLAAPPTDGKANAELMRFVAALFDVPKRQVEILSGHAHRHKRLRVHGTTCWPQQLG